MNVPPRVALYNIRMSELHDDLNEQAPPRLRGHAHLDSIAGIGAVVVNSRCPSRCVSPARCSCILSRVSVLTPSLQRTAQHIQQIAQRKSLPDENKREREGHAIAWHDEDAHRTGRVDSFGTRITNRPSCPSLSLLRPAAMRPGARRWRGETVRKTVSKNPAGDALRRNRQYDRSKTTV